MVSIVENFTEQPLTGISIPHGLVRWNIPVKKLRGRSVIISFEIECASHESLLSGWVEKRTDFYYTILFIESKLHPLWRFDAEEVETVFDRGAHRFYEREFVRRKFVM